MVTLHHTNGSVLTDVSEAQAEALQSFGWSIEGAHVPEADEVEETVNPTDGAEDAPKADEKPARGRRK